MRYESVGKLTVCFGTASQRTSAVVTFGVREGVVDSSPAERPAPARKAPEDPNRVIRLNAGEDQHIISAMDERMKTNGLLSVRGNLI